MSTSATEASHSAFRWLNRGFMVPLHRAGLAAWLGNPATGWQLLLTTTGRRSGLPRDTPLGYVVAEGAAWVMAGYGEGTLWYKNLQADPQVQVLMPARPPFAALATPVDDPAARARIIPRLARSMALPGSMIGAVPNAISDERIITLTEGVPLIALRPANGDTLVAGPDDPGGHAWIARQLGAAAAALLVIRALGWLVSRRPGVNRRVGAPAPRT